MHGIPGLEIELAGKRTWPIVNVYLTIGRLTLYRLNDDSPTVDARDSIDARDLEVANNSVDARDSVDARHSEDAKASVSAKESINARDSEDAKIQYMQKIQ